MLFRSYLRIIAVYSSVVKLVYIALPLSCTYHTTRTQQFTIFIKLLTLSACGVLSLAKLRHVRTCVCSHGRFVPQRTSASATIARTSCFINVHHTTPKLKNNNFPYLSIKSNLRSATDMDDQDLSVLYSRLPFEQYADRYSPQIYSLERYIGPSICRQQDSP